MSRAITEVPVVLVAALLAFSGCAAIRRTGAADADVGTFAPLSRALAAPARPTPADIAACREFARLQPDVPAYTEAAPLNPFPSHISHVEPWTGPVAPTPAPLPAERSPQLVPAEPRESSSGGGAGDNPQDATTEPGAVDPRFGDAFDFCMRARGF